MRPAPIRRLTAPIRRFLRIEAASGFVLVLCTIVALVLANSSLGPTVHHFWEESIRFGIGSFTFDHTLHFWVNDALMTIFFFVIGLEIKRELVDGELSSPRKAALPVVGAIGGMVVPAAIYMLWHPSGPEARGWGIPMATDIAFVVGVMAVFGKRVPFGLKIFLLSLAIADDMGAVLVIAVAYTEHVNLLALAIAGGGFGLTYAMNRLGVRSIGLYVAVAIGIWFAVLASGIHPTISGVLLGLMTPSTAWLNPNILRLTIEDVVGHERGIDLPEADLLAYAARESVSPLLRIETALHPWVGFVIMPVFALANAGVVVGVGAMLDPVAIAIAVALVFGKAIGIFGLSWLAVRFKLASLPAGVTWRMMLAAGILGGIGFTMSLFVAGLAFPDPEGPILAAKTGILFGSGVCLLVGAGLLWWSLRSGPKNRDGI